MFAPNLSQSMQSGPSLIHDLDRCFFVFLTKLAFFVVREVNLALPNTIYGLDLFRLNIFRSVFVISTTFFNTSFLVDQFYITNTDWIKHFFIRRHPWFEHFSCLTSVNNDWFWLSVKFCFLNVLKVLMFDTNYIAKSITFHLFSFLFILFKQSSSFLISVLWVIRFK